ncbi:MAG: hypothetical protein DF168_01110 [Candidatus Moanabacter tarae]|uniref:Uncharacterized protein n=1 Tax=Candidatus Moanibacter tarae TaxID=2200854 RepID=A0A2Z4ACQ1_9BACT|nr:MAG: hypothetical protein DF168_01110 [Candidatus Moanabacter tarae]|tara:strand:+ start:28394 stop:29101 length:708 start_codon:yes stop_codon:yes gene_type:complete
MKYINRLLYVVPVLVSGLLVIVVTKETNAAPDPEIFDGTKYGEEISKHYAIKKVLELIRINSSSAGRPERGGMSSEGQNGIYVRQDGKGMGGVISEADVDEEDGKPVSISMGSEGDAINPSVQVKVIGEKLAELDRKSEKLANSEGDVVSAGQENPESPGQINKFHGAKSVMFGSEEEMIEVAQNSKARENTNEDSEGMGLGDKEMLDGKGPEMRGKNKGRSIGVETGQSIPTDL